MKYLVILYFFSLVSLNLFSQDSREFTFTGSITDKTDEKAIEDFMVDVYVGNEIVQSVQSEKKGKFSVELNGGSSYTIEISKEGYYPKRAIAITNIPEDVKKLPEFKFEMQLIRLGEYTDIESVDPFSTSIFDFPYVIFEYDKKLEDLNYRKEYTEHIKDQYKAVNELR